MTISHSKPCTQLLGIIATGRRDYRILGTDMPTIDDCKRNAEQCLRWADEAANDEQRDTLLEIAGLWTQMELSSAEPTKSRVSVSGDQHDQGTTMAHASSRAAATIPADNPERDFTLVRSSGWWGTPTQSLWPAKTPPAATVSSTCTSHLGAALRHIVMISRRCFQSWRVKSRPLSEERKPSFDLAIPSTFRRTLLTISKTRAGSRRGYYACARRPGKKSFS
jgi:hypothetical protein